MIFNPLTGYTPGMMGARSAYATALRWASAMQNDALAQCFQTDARNGYPDPRRAAPPASINMPAHLRVVRSASTPDLPCDVEP